MIAAIEMFVNWTVVLVVEMFILKFFLQPQRFMYFTRMLCGRPADYNIFVKMNYE